VAGTAVRPNQDNPMYKLAMQAKTERSGRVSRV
jgi:hypothetical protein